MGILARSRAPDGTAGRSTAMYDGARRRLDDGMDDGMDDGPGGGSHER
jgi:hypothetical protein